MNLFIDLLDMTFNNPNTHPSHVSLDLQDVAPYTLLHLSKGQTCYTIGDTLDSVYVLLSGSCRIISYTVDGNANILASLEAPQLFGLIELFTDTPIVHATVEAATDCTLIGICADDYKKLCYTSPVLNGITMTYLANQAFRTMTNYQYVTFKNPVYSILILLNSLTHAVAFPYTIHIKRETLSEMLHINIRTLYRHLAHLRDDDYLSISKGKIHITQAQKNKIVALCDAILPT